jgi:tetratricopeptide (TPR) repeat protein
MPAAPERHSRRPPAARPSAPTPAPVLTDAEAPDAVREARRLAEQGDWEAAQATYTRLMQSGQHLEWIITDLDAATQTRPGDIDLWQNLGDAYLRANRLKEAMHAYSHAEKLLR